MNSMKLKIPQKVYKKISYLKQRFSSLEWSGPAWYEIKKDKHGFPEEWILQHFLPLHLGTASATDWDGKDLVKLLKPLSDKFPKIGKTWVQGNIHSHHTMGAFFSGTDEKQLEDGANINFYGSLVVSTKTDEEWAFAFSYPDQFGNKHIIEIDEVEVLMPAFKEDDEWVKEANWIKKRKKKTPKAWGNITRLKGGQLRGEQVSNDQASLFGGGHGHYGYDPSDWYGADDAKYDEQMEAYDNAQVMFMNGGLSKKQFMKKCKKIGVDQYGTPK